METRIHAHIEVPDNKMTKRLPGGDQNTPGSRFN